MSKKKNTMAGFHTYSKNLDIIDIVILMHGPNPVTTKKVMDKCGLDPRSAQRRIKAIRDHYRDKVIEETTSDGKKDGGLKIHYAAS